MFMAVLVSLETGLLADFCLRIARKAEVSHNPAAGEAFTGRMWIYSAAAGSFVGLFLKHWGWQGQLACGVLAAYLLAASVQDCRSCMVSDFLHCLAAPAGLVFLVLDHDRGKWISLALFVLLQLGLFMRMYGAADGLVFMVCAVYESRFGNGLITYLFHMAAAFGLLGIVQGCRKNIARSGNLKKPVPFVPYIAATVWVFLW